MSNRDTQFKGFAKALLREMLAQRQWDGIDFNSDDTDEIEEYSLVIARRAYDLVAHTLSMQPMINSMPEIQSLTDALKVIPDLPESSEEQFKRESIRKVLMECSQCGHRDDLDCPACNNPFCLSCFVDHGKVCYARWQTGEVSRSYREPTKDVRTEEQRIALLQEAGHPANVPIGTMSRPKEEDANEEAKQLIQYYEEHPEEVYNTKREIGNKYPVLRYIEALELCMKEWRKKAREHAEEQAPVSPLPISPYTGEPYDPASGSLLKKSGGKVEWDKS